MFKFIKKLFSKRKEQEARKEIPLTERLTKQSKVASPKAPNVSRPTKKRTETDRTTYSSDTTSSSDPFFTNPALVATMASYDSSYTSSSYDTNTSSSCSSSSSSDSSSSSCD